ncbi:MAG: rRNA maturation RNase YbeY [Ilumatobacter sp.]|uniref:rRNA maturation RNase YbeY n=1 Tax=Ilumatobacter sp. TaxID=1967498 RepID=UPI0032971090
MSTESGVPVVADDVRSLDAKESVPVDLERWSLLASRSAESEGGVGELTLTFVDEAEIAELNAEHMGKTGPTDVLSFPMDDDWVPGVPTLLGDIVICPEVAATQFTDHAGTFDDEIGLLVVHGVLHVLGHDHADPAEATLMRGRELALLRAHHWHGHEPAGFRQTHD